MLEQYNGVLKSFNKTADINSGIHPWIASLAHYQSQFYSHILSLNLPSEHDIYCVSGLNCSSLPISLSWEVSPSTITQTTDIDYAAISDGHIWQSLNYNATPIMICCFTSRLEVTAGQNVISFN
jgi:hypothetical protein